MGRFRVWVWVCLVAAWGPACGSSAFGCVDDSQCAEGGGICADPGFCAFPDEACASGYVYAEHAVDGLAGMCVAEGGATSTTADGSATTSGSVGPATDAGSGGSTLALDGTGTADGGPTTGTPATSTAADGSSGPGESGSSSDGGPAVQTASFPASWAGCVLLDAASPDLAACAAETGANGMTVDLEVYSLMPDLGGAAALLILPVGNDFDGHRVLDVRLRLHTLPSSDSFASGEVWVVSMFSEMSLATTLPMPQGGGPIAGDQGPNVGDEDIVWSLPLDLPLAGDDLYLGVYPVSTDGVDFFTHAGAVPPVLEVDYLP